MKLTYQLPNPDDPDLNAKVFKAFADQVGQASVSFQVPLDEDGLLWSGVAPLIAVEGDHYDERGSKEPVGEPEEGMGTEGKWTP